MKLTTRTLFTSDSHFGHTNIIKLSKRPFASVEEMDQTLIERWNATVRKTDTVYHLGDFTLGGTKFAKQLLAQLNGHINVLACHWHHDKQWLPKGFGSFVGLVSADHPVEILPPMVSRTFMVSGSAAVDGDGTGTEGETVNENVNEKVFLTLSHYPMASWDRRHYGGYHLHGHSHGRYVPPSEARILDVGVDCHDFAPISLDAVIARLKSRPFGSQEK